MAVASLLPMRGERPEGHEVNLNDYEGQDHLGALDDLVKGRHHAWWRKQFSIR